MKKLLIKIMVFITLNTFIFIFFVFLVPAGETHYVASIIDKHHVLQSAESPKIILAGGSCVSFGVDSIRIRNELQRDVVNMGLHFGFRLRFMLREIEPAIQKDDIVVLMPEYDHFFVKNLDGNQVLFRTLKYDARFLRYFHVKNYLALLKFLPDTIQVNWREWINPRAQIWDRARGYHRYCFNWLGDSVGHLDKPPRVDLIGNLVIPEQVEAFNAVAVELLNSFYARATAKGANVFLTFPAVPTSHVGQVMRERLSLLFAWLQESCEIPFMDSPLDMIYPLECFYDTIYHLSQKGRIRRTEKIIEGLERIVPRASKPGLNLINNFTRTKTLRSWTNPEALALADTVLNAQPITALKIETDQNVETWSDYTEVRGEDGYFYIGCYVRDPSIHGQRLLQLRAYDGEKRTIPMGRVVLRTGSQAVEETGRLDAYNFFQGTTNDQWVHIQGYVLGANSGLESLLDQVIFGKGGIIPRLPRNAEFVRIGLISRNNNSRKTESWFAEPILEKHE